MLCDELTNAMIKLKKQGKIFLKEGASEEQIADFERKNAISLPEKYREWLRYSDGGEFFPPAGIQLYGVAHRPVIDVDEDDRPNDDHIVIGALSDGEPILCEKEGDRILIFDHETGQIDEEQIYRDFFTFLNDMYARIFLF